MATSAQTDLGRSLVEAYNRRDTAALRELFEPDAVWHSARGDQAGIESILQLLRSVDERSGGTFHQEVHDVLASDDHVVVLSRGVGQRDGRSIDDPEVTVFHIREGRVREAWSHPYDQESRARFWG